MFINTHIHTFRDVDVPRRFFPLGLVRILASKPGFHLTAKLLNNINPFSDDDLFDRYVKFVRTGRLGTQQEIFENCQKFYPEDTEFAILSMDMAFMGAGKVPRPYIDQLSELGQLKKKYPQVHPFIHIDPRREENMELLKKCVGDWGFKGVKLYPPLGYYPDEEDLYPVYKYCQDNGLPVIAHCSPYNPVRFKGSKKDLVELLSRPDGIVYNTGKKRKDMCSNFTHPRNYEKVLNLFTDLNLCFAHFGSEYFWEKYLDDPGNEENWFMIIREMIAKYDNVYSDISFTLNNQEFFPLLKVLLSDKSLRDKILFGSDYYMVETKSTERRFGIDLRAFIGEENFSAIATDNPKRFLKI